MAVASRKKSRIRPVKKAQLDDVRSEINVTPLVDVCLVLLIIFMVVTPLLARGKSVPLPMTTQHESETDKNQPVVAIDVDGGLWFDKERVTDLESLKQRVEEAWRAADVGTAAGKIYIKADANLPYVKVYPLIVAMNELDPVGIDLGTNELKEKDK